MSLNTIQEIECAIMTASRRHSWPSFTRGWIGIERPKLAPSVLPRFLRQGLGLFGDPEDAALLDEVVHIPTKRDVARPVRRPCSDAYP
jgi:hypothetical protein